MTFDCLITICNDQLSVAFIKQLPTLFLHKNTLYKNTEALIAQKSEFNNDQARCKDPKNFKGEKLIKSIET